ncbi:MAG: S41 family peptidase, partial [Flavobacteriales bacterium]
GNKNLLDYTIERGDIPTYSVDASFMIDDEIGYIKVNRFSATTNQEFYEGTNKLLSSGMKKLVLDLRGNPGGYLGSAIYMCNEFLDKGELIVYTEGKYRKKEEIFSDEEGRLKQIELAVLIDEGSASASEIVSGCIQDLDRGIIIGKRSFGKGLVQEEIKLSDGSAVRLTTQRYYMPSGRSIQKSYENSELEYNLEHLTRNKNKELEVPDSLKYTTKNGRSVFGGGGVTPDSIIFSDTTLNYTKFNQIRRNNLVLEFSLKYQSRVDKNKGYNFLDSELIYSEFKNYVEEKNPDFDLTMGEKEERDLKNFIKATIAKNMWDKNISFKILSKDDEYILKAVQVLD